ncbi:MAG: AAA domain containing protein [Cenarchaeum symbiont of Oopsacas minuta]|nr:AAA domain containing protein [Cenarchaeum symbiont of Oopsacas minuta]
MIMSENIKITSIKFLNYRQYFGEHNIKFSNRDEGFSVIVGENGAGKSNILNAMNWCFYATEPHATKKNAGYGIINEKYLKSIDNGRIAIMMVQVDIQKGVTKYRISRVLQIIKNEYQYESTDTKIRIMTMAHGYALPAGCEVIKQQSTFEIMVKREHEQDFHLVRDTPHKILMNEILPASLSSYFILDGEFLEKFWSGIQRVKIGIEQISQLHLLTLTKDHLESFKKDVPLLNDKDIDNLTTKIRSLNYHKDSEDVHGVKTFTSEPRYNYDVDLDKNEFYHATGKPRIDDIKDDIKKMINDANEIAEKFGQSNIEVVKNMNTEQKQTQKKYKEFSLEEEKYEKEYYASLIENTPLIFLKSAIKNSIQLVDNLRKKGELPYEAKKIFTNDLLERGTCICHTDLESKIINGIETNNARNEVIKVRDHMKGDQSLDVTVAMKFHFEEKLLGDYDKFTKNVFDDPRIKFSDARNNSNEYNKKLKDINIQLQNIGNVNIEALAKDHDYVMKLIQSKTNEIKDIEYRLKSNSDKVQELESKRKVLFGKNKKAHKIEHEQNIWNTLLEIIKSTQGELKQEIKDEVQEKTMEIFLKTMYKKDQFEKFIIKDNFEVELIDPSHNSILGSLSAGESLFLALSFISAIRNVTGFKFPLIIDTPLGKVSGTPRYLLSRALPEYLPDEQIIFLATDTEFLNPDTNVHEIEGRPELPFGELLEKKINVKYYLIKGMEKNIAQIVDYVPKWRSN